MTKLDAYFEQVRRAHMLRVQKAQAELERETSAKSQDDSLINEIESFLDADLCGEF